MQAPNKKQSCCSVKYQKTSSYIATDSKYCYPFFGRVPPTMENLCVTSNVTFCISLSFVIYKCLYVRNGDFIL